MKKAIGVFRIVTCILISLYTLLVCRHMAQNARYMCYKITPVGEEYVMGFDSITPEAWFFIGSGVGLLALGAVAVVFLFRKGRTAAIVAGLAVITSAVYGVCLNTQLAEVMLWREFMRWLSVEDALAASLSVKPTLAVLCIAAAVCYAVLYLVSYKKSLAVGEDLNEQNS